VAWNQAGCRLPCAIDLVNQPLRSSGAALAWQRQGYLLGTSVCIMPFDGRRCCLHFQVRKGQVNVATCREKVAHDHLPGRLVRNFNVAQFPPGSVVNPSPAEEHALTGAARQKNTKRGGQGGDFPESDRRTFHGANIANELPCFNFLECLPALALPYPLAKVLDILYIMLW